MINPEALVRVVEAGALYGLSRALHEEVKFDAEKVTSVDWMTQPDAAARGHAGAD